MNRKIFIAIVASVGLTMFFACSQRNPKQEKAEETKVAEYLYDGMAIVITKLNTHEFKTSFDQRMWVYPKNGNLDKRICVKIDNDYVISLENVGNMTDLNTETTYEANFSSGGISFSEKKGFYCSEEMIGITTFTNGKVLNLRLRENTPLNMANETNSPDDRSGLMRAVSITGTIVITKKSDPDFKKTLRIDDPIKIAINNGDSFDEYHYSNNYVSF